MLRSISMKFLDLTLDKICKKKFFIIILVVILGPEIYQISCFLLVNNLRVSFSKSIEDRTFYFPAIKEGLQLYCLLNTQMSAGTFGRHQMATKKTPIFYACFSIFFHYLLVVNKDAFVN